LGEKCKIIEVKEGKIKQRGRPRKSCKEVVLWIRTCRVDHSGWNRKIKEHWCDSN